MNKLIKIHPDDNVMVTTIPIVAGDILEINGAVITYSENIALGHKVASKSISKNEPIIKYGVPIGSAVKAIATGDHIHLHNMKSDYISTFILDNQFENGK